jgi:hypothetical protein
MGKPKWSNGNGGLAEAQSAWLSWTAAAAAAGDPIELAVSQALTPAVGHEKDAALQKVHGKACQYFRTSAKDLDFAELTWTVLVQKYAGRVFFKIFEALGEKLWLNQADFLPALTIGIREFFPADLLADVDEPLFQRTLLHAHDIAFEEQRFAIMLWEISSEKIKEKGLRKKVYDAFVAGRRTAVTKMYASMPDASAEATAPPSMNWEDFVGLWIGGAFEQLGADSIVQPWLMAQLFHALIEGGALPVPLVAGVGLPPKGWAFVDQTVQARIGGGGKAAGKGKSKGKWGADNWWAAAAWPY